uniref:guanylate cyclase n=1 Tax=Strigamia maritima TaxID=126957 RepID=T1ITQ8_STRMM
MQKVGEEYFKSVSQKFSSALRCVGETLQDFLSSMDNLHQDLLPQGAITPAFQVQIINCGFDNKSILQYRYFGNSDHIFFFRGLIQQLANDIFHTKITAIRVQPKAHSHTKSNVYECLRISGQEPRVCSSQNHLSPHVTDSLISNRLLCRALPWHFVCNSNFSFVQLGTGFVRMFGSLLKTHGLNAATYFKVLSPQVEMKLEEIQANLNATYRVQVNCMAANCRYNKDIEFKGQMILCFESGGIVFLGSPDVCGLDSLLCSGLYICDIPIHDASRDVVLVGEHSKAQDTLRRQMNKLRTSIEDANTAVEEERQKNVQLLHLIFPPTIAKKLWLGLPIEAETHSNVTMLFSDIVGFTSICSTSTPMMVIKMLNKLYSRFDEFCGQLDVYKVETIGDAYCVAGGLHKEIAIHAQQCAWMALKMIVATKLEVTPDGNVIQMRIGLHSGCVLAGVVGRQMPRYCLFGHHVTLANRFETLSESMRINISPTTYRLLSETSGFSFTARNPTCLPSMFPTDIPGTCYFLNGYQHSDIDNSVDLDASIENAMKEFTISKIV